ncbi:radical SAM protein [Parabacteroides timonensis]|uniref:radical SAM protein n=1 Tax=Parabacteroides timonensis TaxID=1871013 RepID=UPI00094EFED8|nr:radical SAM protein [Parabacteroides timonensis]
MQGTIFSIEEFAVNDGPGIRTTIFLKGCPLRCAWCHNPEGISPEPQYMDKKGERTLCGYRITVDELAGQLLKNKDIYALNNGGITLTGGEPLLQADFVRELLRKINPFVHTAIETSGYAPVSVFKEVLPLLDLVLFDIKQMDPVLHKRYTGVDNRLILKNLETLCSSGNKFIIRVPLIPGVNDTKENMQSILKVIKGVESLVRIELLRYNKIAGAKYSMIGKVYNPPFDPDALPQINNVFEENNIKTIIL